MTNRNTMCVLAASLLWISFATMAQQPSQPTTKALQKKTGAKSMTSRTLTKAATAIKPETCEGVMTMSDCHDIYPGGCENNPTPHYDAYLNFLKDQLPQPNLFPVKMLTSNSFKA